MVKKIIIAIDGHSSCGKSTMAKWLAKKINYIYIDTGAMYRAVTFFALQNNLIHNGEIDTQELQNSLYKIDISFININNQTHITLNKHDIETDIRGIEVSNNVSSIAALPFVRQEMSNRQRKMGESKGIVMDGRDIGTTIFPNAELKIFVTASPLVRAKRRFEEYQNKGISITLDEVLKNIEERDYIDSHREISPLKKAPDALLLDNSELSIDDQNNWLLNAFHKTIESLKHK